MEENKVTKISLSTFFLILAIIAIIVMGIFIYKLNNDKTAEIQKSNELQSQVNSLNGTVSELQEKINKVSETVSSTNTVNNSTNTANSQKIDNNITLKLGNYTVDQVKEDEVGVSNEECGVKLQENNKFQIYMGFGSWHSGKYEIKNNNLICKSTLLEWESGEYGSRNTDVVFTFKIVNNNKLELSNIDINDSNSEKLVYKEGLTVGMTYSIK